MTPEQAKRIRDRIALGPGEAERRQRERDKVKLRPRGNRRLSLKGKLLVQSKQEASPKQGPPPIPTHQDTLTALKSVRSTVSGTASAAEMRRLLKGLKAKARKAGIQVKGKGKLPGVDAAHESVLAALVYECREALVEARVRTRRPMDADADLHARSAEALGRQVRPKPTQESSSRKRWKKRFAAKKKAAHVDEYGSPGVSGVGAY